MNKNLINPEHAESMLSKAQTLENKVPIEKLEQMVMGCPLPGKIPAKPARRGRPPKLSTDILMRRRNQKQEVKETAQSQKQSEVKPARYASFQDTAKNVNISFNPTQEAVKKDEKN